MCSGARPRRPELTKELIRDLVLAEREPRCSPSAGVGAGARDSALRRGRGERAGRTSPTNSRRSTATSQLGPVAAVACDAGRDRDSGGGDSRVPDAAQERPGDDA